MTTPGRPRSQSAPSLRTTRREKLRPPPPQIPSEEVDPDAAPRPGEIRTPDPQARAADLIGRGEGLDALSLDQKFALLSSMASGPDPVGRHSSQLGVLYRSMGTLDPVFEQHDKPKRLRVLETITERLPDAPRRWRNASTKERGDIVRSILEVQCRVLGMGPDRMPTVELLGDGPEPVPGDSMGQYFEDGRVLELITRAPGWEEFHEAMNTVLHEGTHNYQYSLVADLDAGRLAGDPKEKQAGAFKSNFGAYLDSDGGDRESYLAQPVELHATAVGDEAQEYFLDQALMAGADVYEALPQEGTAPEVDRIRQELEAALTEESSSAIYRLMEQARRYLPDVEPRPSEPERRLHQVERAASLGSDPGATPADRERIIPLVTDPALSDDALGDALTELGAEIRERSHAAHRDRLSAQFLDANRAAFFTDLATSVLRDPGEPVPESRETERVEAEIERIKEAPYYLNLAWMAGETAAVRDAAERAEGVAYAEMVRKLREAGLFEAAEACENTHAAYRQAREGERAAWAEVDRTRRALGELIARRGLATLPT
ncbi:hypothetical protein [Streptosporangium sp. NPDC048865]|uniref:hypothetical protein n=1 Tax=Streptosporangium sp. NPDC048865 TaxID=3155766 RepID=UPI00343E84CF